MFILLARDYLAPLTIRFWADQRAKTAIEQGWSEDPERITEALETADAMAAWRTAHEGAWRQVSGSPAPAPALTSLATIAERILRRGSATGISPAAIPAPDSGLRMVSVESFNTLLADAQALAAVVAQREKGEVVHG